MPHKPRVHLERPDKLVRLHVAEPSPLGLFGLAVGCQLLMAIDFEWSEGKEMLIPYLMFLPALLQLIAGIADFMRHNIFGATAFTGYAMFWFGLATVYILEMYNLDPDKAKANLGKPPRQHTGIVAIGYLIFSVILTVLSLALNRILLVVLIGIDFAFFFLTMHIFEEWTGKLVGVALVLVWLASFYGFFAILLLKMAGGEILPIGRPLIRLQDYIITDYSRTQATITTPRGSHPKTVLRQSSSASSLGQPETEQGLLLDAEEDEDQLDIHVVEVQVDEGASAGRTVGTATEPKRRKTAEVELE
jgi:hypothetical protein